MSDGNEGFIIFIGGALLVGYWLDQHPAIKNAIDFIINHLPELFVCIILVVLIGYYVKERLGY